MRVIPRKPRGAGAEAQGRPEEHPVLEPRLKDNLERLSGLMERNNDLISRRFLVRAAGKEACLLHLDGLVDSLALDQDILKPLQSAPREQLPGDDEATGMSPLDGVEASLVGVTQVRRVASLQEVVDEVFAGFTLLLMDGEREALRMDIRGGEIRSLTEPVLEQSITGPQEGMHEKLVINLALVRRKLRDPRLVVQKSRIGRRSRNDMAVLYIDDIADPAIVEEVKARIATIDIDGVLSVNYIAQLIDDNPWTVFPLERTTDRADVLVAELLEGRVVVMVDESAFAIAYPALFVEMLQAGEDYYQKASAGALWRAMRFLAFFLAVSLPAVYVALLGFHIELVPYKLLNTLAQLREEVPLPVVFEAIVMELIIQLVIEAGLRLPALLAPTVGVVTGIILGQAAISAKLASPAMIVVVAMTTIVTFAIPNYNLVTSTRVLRLPMIVLAATFGLFGLALGWYVLLVHMATLQSMGQPYFAPLAPLRWRDMKDVFFRFFLFDFEYRPRSIPHQDDRRQIPPPKGGA
ncbi:MAG: spore germination protein [Syntrophomonadaceae bacterium]|nr:spore germination protein [Syntrophomonadaceae bacterium]